MQPQTHFVDVPGGQIAYDVTDGSGPLIVCAPGIGDRRQLYRFLRPVLAAAGYRVVTMDIRGHGESSIGWPMYSAAALGSDILALVHHLNSAHPGTPHPSAAPPRTPPPSAAHPSAAPPSAAHPSAAPPSTPHPSREPASSEPAVVIAESITTASAIWAAAEAPEQIAGLVLCGPAGRTPPSVMRRIVIKVGGEVAGRFRWAWMAYWASLFKARRPDDYLEYRKALAAMLAEPGRMAALHGMTSALAAGTADECNARMPKVRCPALVVMGTKDPDSRDPAAEATAIAAELHGRAAMIEGAGHYAMAEFPDLVAAEILPFLKQVTGA
jgi:pimeloyl-ACP methyl ester carboxylesterase